MVRNCAILLGFALAGCAAPSAGGYFKSDGTVTNPSQVQLILAQCRGEGAAAVGDYVTGEGPIPWAFGQASRSSKETAVVNACMARNGYLAR